MPDDRTVYLVDGSSVMYRSFFALKLSTASGFPTGAVYGFVNTLKKLTQKYHPRYLGVCFDVSRKTFRQKKYTEYKIQRPPTPDALKMQIPLVKKIAHHYGVTLFEKEGFEADDIIATLSMRSQENGFNVVIITSDKDMYQLIDGDAVVLYHPFKEKLYTQKRFIDEFGFKPQYMRDYLALLGDTSDNVPGAKGIGKVGAKKLISRYHTVEEMFSRLQEMTPKERILLKENKHDIILSKDLVTLETSVECAFNPLDLAVREADHEALCAMYKELEFKSFLKDLPGAGSAQKPAPVREGIPAPAMKKIAACGVLCCSCSRDAFFVYEPGSSTVYKADVKEAKDLLEDARIKKVSYDFKEMFSTLYPDIALHGAWSDVKIAAYLLDSALGDFTLENLCAHYLNVFTARIEETQRPVFIWALHQEFLMKIKGEGLDALFFDTEVPLTEVLAMMEETGVAIDEKALIQLTEEAARQIEQCRRKAYKEAGREFNLNSPKQLRSVLFDELKLPPQKKTKTGYSTNEEVLRKLSKKYVIAQILLEYRLLSKLHSTYLSPFKDQVREGKGRLHTRFIQTGTQTGRLSSRSPNLQNIPARSEYARMIRKVFIPTDKKGCILASDYSQIELRILAHFSQEPALLKAFSQGRDIHAFTASRLFDIPQKDVSRPQREIAKRVNFGIVYGMSSYGLSREMHMREEEAREFIENYFSRYPKVKKYMDHTIRQAQEKGYVKTLFGRIRYLPDINSPNREMREFSRRQAVNAPIQGTAADMIKIAMVKIYDALKKEQVRSSLILQIHDELVFDIAAGELEKIVDIVRVHMENSSNLSVPIITNLKAGKNWLELKPFTS